LFMMNSNRNFHFFFVFRDDFKSERPAGDVVYYHPPQILQEKDVYYMGPINTHEAFYAWANEKCVPLVREITFENAEELTDEGLPFLILFHDANDHEIVADFEREVAKQLMHERCKIIFFLFLRTILLIFSSRY
jgi:endoplasmic reticulum resident protein 44